MLNNNGIIFLPLFWVACSLVVSSSSDFLYFFSVRHHHHRHLLRHRLDINKDGKVTLLSMSVKYAIMWIKDGIYLF